MDLQNIIITTLKSVLFALLAAMMTLPILLSIPGISGYVKNALGLIGIGD
jgi:hypothetical protein